MQQTALKSNDRVDLHKNPFFAAATSVESLFQAWEKVRGNNGSAGGDGVSIERFGFFARAAIPALSKRLRELSYRPGAARRVYVPKKSGGTRPLDIPCVVDRVAQGAAALVLGPKLDALMEPSSFAYRPGRGVADAVAKVASYHRQGFTYVVDADIHHYFENVPHDQLLAKLETAIGDDAILDLIALWLEWYAPSGIGLAQGSPLSPLLANLYLDALDEEFEGRGLRMVRYADDFLLLCRSEAIAEAALPKLKRFLEGHGLALNVEKSKIVPFEQGFHFLGHLFVRSMVLKEVIDDTPPEDAIAAAEALTRAEAERPLENEPVLLREVGEPLGEHARVQHVLYMLEPKRKLTIQNESFKVTGEAEETLLLLPTRRVDRIEVSLGGDIDVRALDLAAAAGVEVCRVNGHGETVGTWSTPDMIGARARRHLAQAAVILDPARRLDLARRIVEGRIRGQRALLHRMNRDRKDVETVAAAVSLKRILRRVPHAISVQQAMGFEGEAAALAWPALARALVVPLGGRTRQRRPAGSPFDLMLNALSALVSRDVRIALLRAGLHPGFAVLHQSEDGEEALVYDLMEEFRAPLIEATAVALVNRKAISAAMFDDVNGMPRMDRSGWAALIRGYEAAAARTVASPKRQGQKVSWRQLMGDQAHALAEHFEDGLAYVSSGIDY